MEQLDILPFPFGRPGELSGATICCREDQQLFLAPNMFLFHFLYFNNFLKVKLVSTTSFLSSKCIFLKSKVTMEVMIIRADLDKCHKREIQQSLWKFRERIESTTN